MASTTVHMLVSRLTLHVSYGLHDSMLVSRPTLHVSYGLHDWVPHLLAPCQVDEHLHADLLL